MHETADLVQRVLALALGKLRRSELREPERIASFLLGIARNAARDLRRTERRHDADPDALRDVAALVNEAPETVELERLRGCLERLSERERSVAVLTYYDECTAARIAEQLGASEANVRVIRHRAMARLRLGTLRGGHRAISMRHSQRFALESIGSERCCIRNTLTGTFRVPGARWVARALVSSPAAVDPAPRESPDRASDGESSNAGKPVSYFKPNENGIDVPSFSWIK